MEYKVKMPPGLETIDVCNPPEDMEFLIRRTFFQFKQGTPKEFIFRDKLRYIDCLVRNLRHIDHYEYRRIGDLLAERVKDWWIEGNDITEVLKTDNELLIDMYMKGLGHAGLSYAYAEDKDLDLQIQKFLTEAIRLVMNYED